MHKRLISLLFSVLVLLSFSTALAESVQPRFSHVRSISAGLSLSTTTATCTGEGSAMSDSDLVYVTVTLLRRAQSGGTWNYVASWSGSGVGVLGIVLERYASITIGYDYQVHVNVQIKDTNGTLLESVGLDSAIRSYHTTTIPE